MIVAVDAAIIVEVSGRRNKYLVIFVEAHFISGKLFFFFFISQMIIAIGTVVTDAHQTGVVLIDVGDHSHRRRNGAAAAAAAAITIDAIDGKAEEAAVAVIGCKIIDGTKIAIGTNAAGMAAVAIEIDATEAAPIVAIGIFATATARDVQAEIIHVGDVIAGCQKKKRMTN